MTDAMRAYLLSIVAASFLCAITGVLVPKGTVRQTAAFVCGLLLVITAVRPVLQVDYPLLSQAISKVLMQTESTRTEVTVKNRELVRDIIKHHTEAYILDKAQAQNMKITVEVIMDGTDTYPYPESVNICGEYSKQQAAYLSGIIEKELAIPKQRQVWSTA